MSKAKQDIEGREYIFNNEKNMREYACSNLWIKEKELSFHKYAGAAVEIFSSKITEYFTFTPQFGRFVGFIDLFDYLEFWLKENQIPITAVNVNVDELSALVYKIDLASMKLGKEKERISGSECITYQYRKEEMSFFDPYKEQDIIFEEWGWFEISLQEEEREDEDIDPQF